MADIELVVKIDVDIYKSLKRKVNNSKRMVDKIELAIANGTPFKEELHREKEQAYYLGYEERGRKNVNEVITRYKNNAEYERTHGNLQGCLEFRQLAEWLGKYQKIEELMIGWNNFNSYERMCDIYEVINNGTDDT